MRGWITYPLDVAGVKAPVKVTPSERWGQVQAPMLLSEAGAAITLINRPGKEIKDFKVEAALPFTPKSVSSAERGALRFTFSNGRMQTSLDLNKVADVIMVKP